MVFLKISQNPQETPVPESLLIKEFSCEILRNIEEHLSYRYLWTTASGILERIILSCSPKKLFWNFYFSFFFFNCTNSTKSRNTSQYLITFVKNGHAWLLFCSCLLPFKVFTKQFYQLMIFLIWWERFQQTLVKADLEKFDSIYLTHIHQRFSGDFRG